MIREIQYAAMVVYTVGVCDTGFPCDRGNMLQRLCRLWEGLVQFPCETENTSMLKWLCIL